MKAWTVCLSLLALMLSTAQAQQEHPGDIRSRECLQALDAGGAERAARAYLKMEEEFRGTLYGAFALFEAAYWTEYPDNIPIYQRVVVEYPDSPYKVPAQISILGFELGSSREYINGLDDLAQSLGGPSLAAIASSDQETLVGQVMALPRDRQRKLWVVYSDCGLTLTQGMSQFVEALPLAIFYRNAFSASEVGDGVEGHLVELCINKGNFVPADHETNPVVAISSPAENEVTGPTPTITSTITVGDVTHVQADLGKTQVHLNGQDVKPLTTFRSTFATTLQPGVPFETVSVSTTPAAPLSEGQHTYTLVVPIAGYKGQGPGQTTITRHFVVRTTPPDPTTETLPASKDAWSTNGGRMPMKGPTPG